MNLFLLLGQLGLSGDLSGQPLLPVGTVYDPFVLRGLDAFIYARLLRRRGSSSPARRPASRWPPRAARTSRRSRASVGLELPEVTLIEPAYAVALDWLLCDALGRIATGPAPSPRRRRPRPRPRSTARTTSGSPPGRSTRRRSRRRASRLGDAVLRRQVLAGAYRLVDATEAASRTRPQVSLVASGAVLPEVLAAAGRAGRRGHRRARRRRDVAGPALRGLAAHPPAGDPDGDHAVGRRRAARGPAGPDAGRHRARRVRRTRWPGSGPRSACPAVPVGVDRFGQSGTIADLYALHDLTAGLRSSTPRWPRSRCADLCPSGSVGAAA